MKRSTAGLIISGLMALTVLVGVVSPQTSEAAGSLTVTVNGCNAEMKWKPSQFANRQMVSISHLEDAAWDYYPSPRPPITTGSYVFRALPPGNYHVSVKFRDGRGPVISALTEEATFAITCNPAFPY